ncbi:MAG: copper-binding protein [Terriglobia bacterium]
MVKRIALAALLVALATAGCGQQDAQGPATQGFEWRVKGTIVSTDAAGKRVSIDHQDIPGLMAAMTMTFPVEDAQLLEGIAEGDAVEFVLTQTSAGLSVTRLRKIDPVLLVESASVGQTWQGQGTVVLVNRRAASVLLKHEGVKGLMPASEMVLSVVPPSLLKGIEDDTEVEFTLKNTEKGLVISGLKKLE